MSRRWPGEQTCRRHPERITPTSQEAAPCAQRMPSQSWAQPEDRRNFTRSGLAGCSRAGRGQHVGEPVADVDALPEPIGQGCLGVDVVRCRRDRVHRWDATNGSPAATDCSQCRGNRSRSPRRPSVANATGAHTGLASIAGPVLILISGAHRVDTAMVAANLRVRRLRRAAADFVREHRGYDIGCVAAASPASGPDVHRSGIRAVRRDLGCGGPPGCRVQPELRVFGTLTGAIELEVTDG